MRSVSSWLLALLATAFWGTASVFVWFFDRSGDLSHSCMRWWSRTCLRLGGIEIEVEGADRIPRKGPFVVVANHQGQVDIMVLTIVLPFKFFWIAKKELFRIPFVGWHMKLSGHVSVDRENRESAIRSMERASEKLLRGESLVIFPEGTRSRDGKLQRFKSGAFHMALQTGVPILPVAIRGSFAVLPKGSLLPRPAGVSVRVFPPMPTAGMGMEAKEKLRENVRTMIEGELSEGALTPRGRLDNMNPSHLGERN